MTYARDIAIRQALYALKREYGASVDIVTLVSSTIDARTGEKSQVTSVVRVHQAIVLPIKSVRNVERNIAIISANKQLTGGGSYDKGTSRFIIDRRDARSLSELTQDDWLVHKNKKYQIREVEDFEDSTAWMVTATALIGESPGREQSVTVAQHIGISESTASDLDGV